MSYSPANTSSPLWSANCRWRVLPAPGDRVPGTFDQDVYVELFHRFHDAGSRSDGTVTFTLHAFLRAMGRRVDGRTYEQLRGALTRLERTVLESTGAYFVARTSPAADDRPSGSESEPAVAEATARGSGWKPPGEYVDERLTLLTAVSIDRRRTAERDQLALFPTLTTGEPGEARVTLSPMVRANIAAGHTASISAARYFELPSPTARRLYRLLAAVRAELDEPGGGTFVWDVALEALAEQLPLSQRYPSHLQRVLEPAHTMLKAAGLIRDVTVRQQRRMWVVHYELV